MKLPWWATQVTWFSKLLALVLFITLPILTFIAGADYQKRITPKTYPKLITRYKSDPRCTPALEVFTTKARGPEFVFDYNDRTIDILNHGQIVKRVPANYSNSQMFDYSISHTKRYGAVVIDSARNNGTLLPFVYDFEKQRQVPFANTKTDLPAISQDAIYLRLLWSLNENYFYANYKDYSGSKSWWYQFKVANDEIILDRKIELTGTYGTVLGWLNRLDRLAIVYPEEVRNRPNSGGIYTAEHYLILVDKDGSTTRVDATADNSQYLFAKYTLNSYQGERLKPKLQDFGDWQKLLPSGTPPFTP